MDESILFLNDIWVIHELRVGNRKYLLCFCCLTVGWLMDLYDKTNPVAVTLSSHSVVRFHRGLPQQLLWQWGLHSRHLPLFLGLPGPRLWKRWEPVGPWAVKTLSEPRGWVKAARRKEKNPLICAGRLCVKPSWVAAWVKDLKSNRKAKITAVLPPSNQSSSCGVLRLKLWFGEQTECVSARECWCVCSCIFVWVGLSVSFSSVDGFIFVSLNDSMHL